MMAPRAHLREHPEALRLYAVTDDAWLAGRTLVSCVEAALRGGATFVQLRAKHASTGQRAVQARSLAFACAAFGAPLLVNDDVGAALLCDADGVHIGQDDAACAEARRMLGEDKIVGVSVQTVAQARAAEAAGADYLGVGALFKTATKPEAADVSIETLSSICAAVSIPVVGIGGLDARSVSALAGTGVAGAAVVSALFAADDIEAAARDLKERLDHVL